MNYRERRAQQSRRTEQAILAAAAELSREYGFDKVSIRDICRRAGVTTGAFYHHFPSKEAMLTNGFTSLDAYLENYMAQSGGTSPSERLSCLLRGYAAFFQETGPALVGRYYQQRLGDPSFASLAPGRYTLQTMLDCLREYKAQGRLAPDQSPEWAAEFLFRHFRGVVIDWVLHQGDYPLLPKLEQDYQFFEGIFRRDAPGKE